VLTLTPLETSILLLAFVGAGCGVIGALTMAWRHRGDWDAGFDAAIMQEQRAIRRADPGPPPLLRPDLRLAASGPHRIPGWAPPEPGAGLTETGERMRRAADDTFVGALAAAPIEKLPEVFDHGLGSHRSKGWRPGDE